MTPRRRRLRNGVLAGVRRLGVEDEVMRAGNELLLLRRGAKARRNVHENRAMGLVAAAVLRQDSNCVDIGANQGDLLEVFTSLAPRGRHIAYEPVPAMATKLARRFPRVDVRRVALANSCEEGSFVVHKALASRSSLRPVGYSPQETETIDVVIEPLDRSLPQGFVPTLIKVDVEGAEQLVFEGARETLRAHAPVLLFEHQRNTARHFDTGPEHLFDLLATDLGYRIFDLDACGPYSRAEFANVYVTGSRWNFLATRTLA